MFQVLLGIGTNLGDRTGHLQYAVDALALLPMTQVKAVSSVYETAPIGYEEQGYFYNAVVLIETELSPTAVLGAALGIEAARGRQREVKAGPRVLDGDLRMSQGVKVDVQEWPLPHPRMFQRRFVLEPLMELFPNGVVFGACITGKLQDVQEQEIKKTDVTLHL
ncbi:MAG: 2-amino-4-hydroxy-6-hydroxymethyldihydropteridine diphosphokinase [Clostridiales bacterium]|nr:2-amino-4-hydroxy-6-hydroxymethyldihydropteridine diphosphokinase [Clostridiales bacterium]